MTRKRRAASAVAFIDGTLSGSRLVATTVKPPKAAGGRGRRGGELPGAGRAAPDRVRGVRGPRRLHAASEDRGAEDTREVSVRNYRLWYRIAVPMRIKLIVHAGQHALFRTKNLRLAPPGASCKAAESPHSAGYVGGYDPTLAWCD